MTMYYLHICWEVQYISIYVFCTPGETAVGLFSQLMSMYLEARVCVYVCRCVWVHVCAYVCLQVCVCVGVSMCAGGVHLL